MICVWGGVGRHDMCKTWGGGVGRHDMCMGRGGKTRYMYGEGWEDMICVWGGVGRHDMCMGRGGKT